jgi:catalase
MTDTGKEHLVASIASHVKADVKPELMPRVIKYWASVHPDLSAQAATQLTGSDGRISCYPPGALIDP